MIRLSGVMSHGLVQPPLGSRPLTLSMSYQAMADAIIGRNRSGQTPRTAGMRTVLHGRRQRVGTWLRELQECCAPRLGTAPLA